MQMSEEDIEAAYHVNHRLLDPLRKAGRPINRVLENWCQKVDLMWEMSRAGRESDGPTEELETWISTREAARELELSPRQTRRLKTDLDGEDFNGRLMFRQSKVRTYAEGKRNGGSRPRG
jgi:hypothetical protein